MTHNVSALDAGPHLHTQYLAWLRTTPSEQWATATMPDTLAHQVLDTVRAAAAEDPRLDALLRVHQALLREFTQGRRCGVCADADDPTYDHGTRC